MFNILLDEKPTTWNGYPINTDFRVGIQIMQITYDNELSDGEKMALIVDLLFSGIKPTTPEELAECLNWYLQGWLMDKNPKGKQGPRVLDFDVDQWRIYSAFMSQYHINLNTADLHYWEFMGLLSTLDECAFTRIADIRSKKIDAKMSKEEKKALAEVKKIYALEETEKIDNQHEVDEAVARFMANRKGV